MNNAAIIAKVDKIIQIEGANTIQEMVVLGEHIVGSKDWKEGGIGIFFPVNVQLSHDFCRHNNLYRDSTKNVDSGETGFFEDNRRVRAQPFMKVRSSGLFMPLSSLDYLGADKSSFSLGFSFNDLEGQNVCQKYYVEKPKQQGIPGVKKAKMQDFPSFDKHVDTLQFLHNLQRIEKGSLITISAKAHGTSWRVGKKKRNLILPKWKELVNRVFPIFPEQSGFELVVGTRNVIVDNEEKVGFHGSEHFRVEMANQIAPYLEDGMTAYGELYGMVNGKPVMPPHDVSCMKDKAYLKKYGKTVNFTYGCGPDEYRWFVYRITREDVNGNNIDMTNAEMKRWCEERNIPSTTEVCDPFIYDGNPEALQQKVIDLSERGDLLAECYINPTQWGEGVVLRVENGTMTPDFYKYKNYCFRAGESLVEVPDMEDMS